VTSSRFALLVNAAGGSADDAAVSAVRTACAEKSLDVEVHEIDGDPAQAAARAADAGCDVVVACGGDGTVGAVAAVAVERGLVLGVLPLGTLNHFAQDLGLPDDPVDAVDVLAGGRTAAIDLGCVGDVVFVNNASIGAYAEIVARRERMTGRGGKWWLAARALWAAAPFRRLRLQLDVDGEPVVTDATLVLFSNNAYETDGLAFTRSRLDAGRLGVYAFGHRRVRDALRLVVRALRGSLGEESDVLRREGRVVTVRSVHAGLLVAHDGEVDRMSTPLTLQIKPRALRVLVPADSPHLSPSVPSQKEQRP
jgi:diacylglycerol kinase family enzyme